MHPVWPPPSQAPKPQRQVAEEDVITHMATLIFYQGYTRGSVVKLASPYLDSRLAPGRVRHLADQVFNFVSLGAVPAKIDRNGVEAVVPLAQDCNHVDTADREYARRAVDRLTHAGVKGLLRFQQGKGKHERRTSLCVAEVCGFAFTQRLTWILTSWSPK